MPAATVRTQRRARRVRRWRLIIVAPSGEKSRGDHLRAMVGRPVRAIADALPESEGLLPMIAELLGGLLATYPRRAAVWQADNGLLLGRYRPGARQRDRQQAPHQAS